MTVSILSSRVASCLSPKTSMGRRRTAFSPHPPTPEARDRFVAAMRQHGVVMGGCGEKAVRLRPMLAEYSSSPMTAACWTSPCALMNEMSSRACRARIGSGKFWAHEAWKLDHPPDFVTFSKKMQAAGFYHNADCRGSRSPSTVRRR
jgi:hypothetical protein